MIWVLLAWVVALLALVIFQQHRLDVVRDRSDIEHAKCIAHIAHYVGNSFASQVLLAAADDYNSPDGVRRLNTLARTEYSIGGPDLPAIWLMDRAKALKETR